MNEFAGVIHCKKIPSEHCGYNVWAIWGRRSGFMLGTVRRDGRRWSAVIQDGRGHNPLNGTKRKFMASRYDAVTWLKDSIMRGRAE